MRGEYQVVGVLYDRDAGSPPLARGIRCTEEYNPLIPRITPACAGNTKHLLKNPLRTKDHPRLRGEYFSLNATPDMILGSPPLARGILSSINSIVSGYGITPACAGNTKIADGNVAATEDHPRLRGEYCLSNHPVRTIQGSPPLARGIRMILNARHNRLRITPACAGNTIKKRHCPTAPGDHPRLRGEYQQRVWNSMTRSGSPPLARGILYNIIAASYRHRITPACAGNTLVYMDSNDFQRDHPRLRGEYIAPIALPW